MRAVFCDAAMLCLTATASKTTLVKIKELFVLKDPNVITESPDRKNIRLYVHKVGGVGSFQWIIDALKTPQQCPRTIIYCRRLRDCSALYHEFCLQYGKNTSCLQERVFDMVHSKTPDNVKDYIASELMADSSRLRVVIATKVLGMGLDIKCDQVVHYGPPATMDDYLQQIGRAGRNFESQAHAILLFSGRQLRNVDSVMTKFIKTDTDCLRKSALADYPVDTVRSVFDPVHLCCSFCSNSCECDQCELGQNGYELFLSASAHQDMDDSGDEIMNRYVSEDEKVSLANDLFTLKDHLDRDVLGTGPSYTGPEVLHGLTVDVIHCILDESQSLFSVDDIINSCHLTNYETVCRVATVLSCSFGDMDVDFSVGDDCLTDV